MKKLMALLMALLMGAAALPALAEEEVLPIPVEILPISEDVLSMTDAIAKAQEAIGPLPANCLTRAELVRMSDDSRQWIVTVFELTAFSDGWSVAMNAETGAVITRDVTNVGYFQVMTDRWEAARGVEYLWSLEDKLLFDTLYTIMPSHGMPIDGDMSHGEALEIAVKALGMTSAADYQIGFGYLMGHGDASGVWEVCFVRDGMLMHKVNLDAVTGQIYLIEPDEEGNG